MSRIYPTAVAIATALLLSGCAVEDSDGSGGSGGTAENNDASGSADTGFGDDTAGSLDTGFGSEDGGMEDGPSGGEGSPPVGTFEGAPLAPLSDGECPDLSTSGSSVFSSGGIDRTVVISLPGTVRAGLPALTIWHGLGDSAESMNRWMGVSNFARDNDVIAVVPDSIARSSNTWDISGGGGVDLVLYDDIRTCLSQELDIDLNRYYATGFSFGGLWTTFLTINRADTLATTIPFSGGTIPFWIGYESPAWAIPVLLVWGGETDTYGSGATGVDFDEAANAFSSSLRGDGHVVAHCDHGGGHTVPSDVGRFFATWLLAHSYGQPSPYETEPLTGFPDYCYIP
jgi:poly(3-hydroxybutyrate) depolymerase